MAIEIEPSRKPYSSPTLKTYGTMVALTKTGTGSCGGGYGKRKKRSWSCDDDD